MIHSNDNHNFASNVNNGTNYHHSFKALASKLLAITTNRPAMNIQTTNRTNPTA